MIHGGYLDIHISFCMFTIDLSFPVGRSSILAPVWWGFRGRLQQGRVQSGGMTSLRGFQPPVFTHGGFFTSKCRKKNQKNHEKPGFSDLLGVSLHHPSLTSLSFFFFFEINFPSFVSQKKIWDMGIFFHLSDRWRSLGGLGWGPWVSVKVMASLDRLSRREMGRSYVPWSRFPFPSFPLGLVENWNWDPL